MSDLMRWPGGRDKSSSPKPDNSWLKYVCESHLEWLMDLVDRMRRGELLDDEDAFDYNSIREQAETIMTIAIAENWSKEECRVNMINTWWRKDHATP